MQAWARKRRASRLSDKPSCSKGSARFHAAAALKKEAYLSHYAKVATGTMFLPMRRDDVTKQQKEEQGKKQRTNLVLDEPASEGLPEPFVLALQATDQHDIAARGLHVPRAVGGRSRALGGAGDSLFVRHEAVRVAHGVESC